MDDFYFLLGIIFLSLLFFNFELVLYSIMIFIL